MKEPSPLVRKKLPTEPLIPGLCESCFFLQMDCSDDYIHMRCNVLCITATTVPHLTPCEYTSELKLHIQLRKISATMFFIIVAILASTSNAYKLLGMPRFLANTLPSIASSVPGQEVMRISPAVRELQPITIGSNRELLAITDRDFSENVLESEGLSIVFFTR